MKVYDISQKVFSCEVYEGDPTPRKETLCSMNKGDLYNLTAFYMCAHNGTHVDAPRHFIADGDAVDELSLGKTVGYAFVAYHDGIVSSFDAEEILKRANAINEEAAKRILIKGRSTVSDEAAEVFASAGLYLLGNESQTVGDEKAPMKAHKALLGGGTVLLEGIRLSDVDEGVYLLCAQPLNLEGADGAPTRAILIEL
jgi:arylformamidase